MQFDNMVVDAKPTVNTTAVKSLRLFARRYGPDNLPGKWRAKTLWSVDRRHSLRDRGTGHDIATLWSIAYYYIYRR